MTIASTSQFTPEDLLRLPDAVNYELVDGKLVERHMGFESSQIAGQIFGLIWAFLQIHRIGRIMPPDASYQCFGDDPNRVRKPDVSFIRSGRLPDDAAPKGHCPIPPDLAVEVVSPGDLASEVEEKVREYLDAGVRLVWVVHPGTRTVHIHRPPSSPQGVLSGLNDNDTITGEDILPGFSAPVRTFFE